MNAQENQRRPLSPAGREHVTEVARRVADLGLMLEEVRHSGKERARETAEIFAAWVGVAVDRVRAAGGLRPKDDVEPVTKELEEEGRSIALVGHLPFMGQLASRLLAGDSELMDLRFGDAGCLVVKRTDDGWRLEQFINHGMAP